MNNKIDTTSAEFIFTYINSAKGITLDKLLKYLLSINNIIVSDKIMHDLILSAFCNYDIELNKMCVVISENLKMLIRSDKLKNIIDNVNCNRN
jgi:hypothetical protein